MRKNLILWLGHLFFPRECVHCGILLDYRNQNYLCSRCRELIEMVEDPICECCGRSLPASASSGITCPDCRENPPDFRSVRSSLFFTEAGQSLIRTYKYSANPYLCEAVLRPLLAGKERWYGEREYDRVLPVPLHPRKARERGFDQSALLAAGLSRATGIPLGRRTLSRFRYTASQTRLNRKERGENMEGAFAFTGDEGVEEKSLLLVDDVYTSGATVKECAKVLMKAGAKSVDVLTLARAVQR